MPLQSPSSDDLGVPLTPIMENQMENEIETGLYRGID